MYRYLYIYVYMKILLFVCSRSLSLSLCRSLSSTLDSVYPSLSLEVILNGHNLDTRTQPHMCVTFVNMKIASYALNMQCLNCRHTA